jgi:hypothetical protein
VLFALAPFSRNLLDDIVVCVGADDGCGDLRCALAAAPWRRRSKSADTEDQSLFQLTAEEEARLERLSAAEPSPDKPV